MWNPNIFVWILNDLWQKGSHSFGFQMFGLLDFRSHSKSRPFATKPLFDHSKARLVRISDPHCQPVNPRLLQIYALKTNLDISPESRARPRATQQGCTKCGGISPCQRSGHRKKFRRKAEKTLGLDIQIFVPDLCSGFRPRLSGRWQLDPPDSASHCPQGNFRLFLSHKFRFESRGLFATAPSESCFFDSDLFCKWKTTYFELGPILGFQF